ncbi:MAG TPA: GNAT family N-acetyltransferase [Devosiaceae bacterium]|jgi:GNAT superfamily N-acetyltransferase
MANFFIRASIRAAQPADTPVLLAMIADLAAHHGDTATTDALLLAADLFGDRPWATAFVAEDLSGLTGYAVLCPLYRAQFGQRGMNLHHLFVKLEKRGMGIGSSLIQASLDYARAQRCSYFMIGAASENLAAQAFYERLGFERLDQSGVHFMQTLAPSKI